MADCSKCNQKSDALRILKCISCFKTVCEKCSVRRYGRWFCSGDCAKNFFLDENGELGIES